MRRSETTVRLVYMPGQGKQIFVNGAPLERLADIVGRLPVVVFSPEDYDLTAGGPKERRRFLNNILSQAHPAYLDDTMTYRRARRQRNEVLRQYKSRAQPPPAAVLKPWTEKIVALGSRVVQRRLRFLNTFRTYLQDAYEQVEAVAERPSIAYDSIADLDPEATVGEIEAAFREVLQRRADAERQRGTTLAGPQRDELVFCLDDLEVRRYGSQGQHRTFGMALKLAQYFYLRDRLDERPLLLLDDAFGKLDAERTAVFLRLLQSEAIGQSIITATRRAPFAETVDFAAPSHRSLLMTAGEEGIEVRTSEAPSDAEVVAPSATTEDPPPERSAERSAVQ
jgi:DNA replication and repair protein RecF